MKKYAPWILLSLTLLVIRSINLSAEELVLESNNNRASSQNLNQQIASSSLNSRATTKGMFTISRAGRYVLSTDLTAAPCTSNVAIIYINTSNTILDLDGRSITLSTTGNITSCRAAIEIAPGLRNVTIMNGGINGQSFNGTSSIYIKSGIYTAGTSSAINSNISLQHLAIENCSQYGLYFMYCDNLSCDKINIYGTTSTSAQRNFPAGLYLNTNTYGLVTNSVFNATKFTAVGQGASYGIYATNCSNYVLEKVSASSNTISSINTVERSGVYGIYLNQCTAFHCMNVKTASNQHLGINTNSSTGNECCGIYLNGTTGSIFEQCIANNNTGGYQYGSNYTCSTYGFKLTSSAAGNAFTQCESSSNLGAADAAGFMIGQSGSNVFDSCLSLNNTSSKTNFGSRFSYGITTTFGCNNYFANCKANGNAVAARISNKGYGFSLRTELGARLISCETNFNGAGGVNLAGEAYGIACLGHCSKYSIEYCKMACNIATTKMYGFKDFSSACKGFLFANIAFGHGITLNDNATLTDSGTMNYFLTFNSNSTGIPDVRRLFKDCYNDDLAVFTSNSKDTFNYSITEN